MCRLSSQRSFWREVVQPTDVVAGGLAEEDSYGVLWAINGYREDVCLAE